MSDMPEISKVMHMHIEELFMRCLGLLICLNLFVKIKFYFNSINNFFMSERFEGYTNGLGATT